MASLAVDDLFDGPVLASAVAIDSAREDDLLAEERALLGRAVPRRRRELAAGRTQARALLARLGGPPAPLLRGEGRAPRWPAGFVGSISHAGEWCAVAVARAAQVLALGLDLERDEPLETEVAARVCTPRELAALPGRDAAERGRHAMLVFSAKEASYKAVYPLVRRVLGFQEVELELHPVDGRFAVRFPADVCALLPHAAAPPRGRFARRAGCLVTTLTIRPESTEANAQETPT
jgi:4'-phosphopantetheinyl transferase EntD